MNAHEEVLALIPGYPELATHERRAVDAHAETCEQCAAALDRQRQLRSEIAHAPRLSPDPVAVEAVRAAIRRKASPWSVVERSGNRAPGLAVAVAVVLILVAGSGLWLMRQASSNTAAIPSPVPFAAPVTPPAPATPAAGTQDDEGYPDAVAWLKQNTMPLASVEPGGSTADLAPLRDIVGGARIVVMDDSTYYGTHELQAMQQRVLEYLVQESGFNNVLMDEPWTHVEPINDYILRNGGSLEELLPQLTGNGWQTAEMAYTFRWLNAHNQGRDSSTAVTVHGFLPVTDGEPGPAIDLVRAYLAQVDPGVPADTSATGLKGLGDRLTEHRDEYVARSSVDAYNQAMQAARILMQVAQLGEAAINERRQLTIQFTADNLFPVIDQAGAGEKFLVITHGTAGSAAIDPATLLRLHYGDQMVVLGFIFRQGTLYTTSANGLVPSPEKGSMDRTLSHVPPAVPDSYEDYFAQAGLRRFVVDVRKLSNYFVQIRRNDPVVPPNRWLSGQHLRWQIIRTYDECYPEDAYALTQLQSRYDAVIYVDQVSPATPLVKLPEGQATRCQRGPENLDFRAGTKDWVQIFGTGENRVEVEAAGTGGQPTVYLRWTGASAPKESWALGQMFRADDYRGQRVRFSATLAVDSPSAFASLAMQVFGPRLEGGGQASVQVKSGDASRYEIVMDVPQDATRIIVMIAPGTARQVSVSDVRFEWVGKDVPVSPQGPDGTMP